LTLLSVPEAGAAMLRTADISLSVATNLEDVEPPEPRPASVWFMLAGLVGVGWLERRRSS